MPLWVCIERCTLCSNDCERCEHRDLPVTIFIQSSESRPDQAVDGSCQSYDELLAVMQNYFTFDDRGHMHLKD